MIRVLRAMIDQIQEVDDAVADKVIVSQLAVARTAKQTTRQLLTRDVLI